MNEPLFTQMETDRHRRRRFWTGMPPTIPDRGERPSLRELGYAPSLMQGLGPRLV